MVGFETCGPNEAIVVSGMCTGSRPKYVTGGRLFVLPWVQKAKRLNLDTMTLNVESAREYTLDEVPISISGIAQVRFRGENEEMLKFAAEQFLDKSISEIQKIILETLEAHQCGIMGTMTAEQIYKDHKKFSKSFFEVASSDLYTMGISVINHTIKDVRDDEGYFLSLGLSETAQVKQDARIGEAEAGRDSGIKALTDEARMTSK